MKDAMFVTKRFKPKAPKIINITKQNTEINIILLKRQFLASGNQNHEQ